MQVCKLADIFDNLTDIAQLPPARHAHHLMRAEQYFAVLEYVTAPEARRPIALVRDLIDEMRSKMNTAGPTP